MVRFARFYQRDICGLFRQSKAAATFQSATSCERRPLHKQSPTVEQCGSLTATVSTHRSVSPDYCPYELLLQQPYNVQIHQLNEVHRIFIPDSLQRHGADQDDSGLSCGSQQHQISAEVIV